MRKFYNLSYPEAVAVMRGGQTEPAPNSRTNYVLTESQVPAYKAYDKNTKGKLPPAARRFKLPAASTDMRPMPISLRRGSLTVMW